MRIGIAPILRGRRYSVQFNYHRNMHAVELKFQASAPGNADEVHNAITTFTAALVRNDNLVQNSLISDQSLTWTVHGIAPGPDALKESYWNKYIHDASAGLSAVSVNGPDVRYLGVIPETGSVCECEKTEALLLFTTFMQLEPPLRCMECNGIFPTYYLPPSASGEPMGLRSWASNYQACDMLQMNCSVGERFGTRQLSNLHSELTRSGLAVCAMIRGMTGLPVYYYLLRPSGRSRAAEMRRNCPNCGGTWTLEVPLHGLFDCRCDKCHLLSNIAWNIR